jgi:hypothetical protein
MTERLYAPRAVRCIICALPAPKYAEVNAAIWDGRALVSAHRKKGQAAYIAQTGAARLDPKVIDRHVEHTQASWHTTPPSSRERSVFPHDYEGLTESVAKMGSEAVNVISRRLEEDPDAVTVKDLAVLAKLGMGARQHQAALATKQRSKGDLTIAIFGIVSGHMAQLPEGEVLEVIDAKVLRDSFDEERALLEERAAG